jgi:RNA polymerase sigma-70 factor (ECF subfamily)
MNEYSGFSQASAKATILLAQSGDRNAMQEIYETYASPCFNLANRISANQTAAQDIVHNVFVKVMKNIQTFDHSGAFAGWVRKIAVNESIAYLNSQSSFSQTIDLVEDVTLNELAASNTSYESRWWETCNDLSKLSAKLSDQARAVLFLHEIEGYSHKEIAVMFNKSESFSKQTLARAMAKLQGINSVKGA